MSMSIGSKFQFEPGSWMEAVHDFYIGIVVGTRHSMYLGSRVVFEFVLGPLLHMFGVSLKKEEIDDDGDGGDGLKVVAVGYGRTGTYSLKLALDELGYPTLHTQHLYEHVDIIDMWTNSIFMPSIRNNKVDMGRPNLKLIAKKFKATADLPMALYFEQVMEEYPDCKFILTSRENSEIWFRSWDMLTKSITQPAHFGGIFFNNVRQYTYYLRWLYAVVNQDEKFLTVPFPPPNQKKDSAIASYEEHNRRVRELIPSDKLLEYNVREGWQPLCDFLEIDSCPDTPFPKSNSARSVQVQSVSAQIVPLTIVLFILFYSFAKGVERLTGMTVVQYMNWKCRQLSVLLLCYLNGEKICMSSGKLRPVKSS